jgi:hypothetical protein
MHQPSLTYDRASSCSEIVLNSEFVKPKEVRKGDMGQLYSAQGSDIMSKQVTRGAEETSVIV